MTGFFLRIYTDELRTYIRNSTLLEERIDAFYHGDPAFVPVEWAWEGLLFLLTGEGLDDDPKGGLAKIFNSERIIDEEQDLAGYGPARYVNPEEVLSISKELSTLDRDELYDRYDPDLMEEKGIYPLGWAEGIMIDEVLGFFDNLKDFFAAAAREEEAVIFYII
ncbi:MAG: DUF1877 family protein [Chitinophagaceae bacterium]|nr:MAG: DUF1877 family protein [Chitinophagaceae bacterium]